LVFKLFRFGYGLDCYYKNGKFVLSLDFELHWGGVELWDLVNKGKDYFAKQPELVQNYSFNKKYDIHCTWATVGLCFKRIAQLKSYIPELKPSFN
jgi:hypothetical protein